MARTQRWIAWLSQPRRAFAVTLVPVFLVMSAWSLATPLFASPDEPTHVIRAVALDHGQLIGNSDGGPASAFTFVTVPALIAGANGYPGCFLFRSSVPASCTHPLTSSTRPVVTTTYAGRYPPLYYAFVGLPSLATISPTGVYLMRLVSASFQLGGGRASRHRVPRGTPAGD